MKKLLALGISLAMMASLSAVAFAAEIQGPDPDGTNPQSAGVDVVVEGKGPTEPDVPGADENWTVYIPADYTLTWDNEKGSAVTQEYSIKGQLSNLSTVEVAVTPFGEDALTLETEDKAGTILADVTGVEKISITGANNTASADLTVGVAAEDFDTAFVGAYSGQLTFDVTYSNTIVE